MSRATPIMFAALIATGCSEFDLRNNPDNGNGAVPDILVDPPSLTYGLLSSGEDEVKTFNVQNIGDATLNVGDIVIGSGIAFTVLGPEVTFDLEPGESMDVDVSFTPMGADENFGQVLVFSDDPDTPEAPVDLMGLGAVPDLEITPDSHNFGEAFIPCGDLVDLELKNVGSEDLVIDDLAYTSAGQLTLDDAALRAQLPLTLAPGATTFVTVHFNPATVGSDTGMLEVFSNDPAGVETADQNGEGGYAEDASEEFTEPGQPPIDVLWLLDQSCSMSENQNAVQAGVPDFLAELQLLSDWQLIQVTGSDACANGGILDSSSVNAENLLINNAFGGFAHTKTEKLMQLASDALAKTGAGDCNQGFLRPGALLHVIVTSDETEQSNQPWDYWLADFSTYVSSNDYVKVSGVIDVNGACGGYGGSDTGPWGYTEAISYTGGTEIDICQPGWGAQMTDLATNILAGIRTYNLADPAIESSIVVTVNGVETTDWTYNTDTDSVTINNPPVGEGDIVVVDYGLSSECI